MKLSIEEATKAQLVQFAGDYLGIELSIADKKETMLAKIKTAWAKPEIMVDDVEVDDDVSETQAQRAEAAPPPPATQEQKTLEESKANPKTVTIMIQTEKGPGGEAGVPVGVNGKVMLIPRGKNVEVPYSYYEVLLHAERLEYEMDESGNHMNPIPRKIPAYPMHRVA